MVKAYIRIQLSDGRWKADVSRDYADTSLRLLGAMLDDGRAVETVEISGDITAGALSDIDSHPDIGDYELVERHDNSATIQLETLEPAVLTATARAGIPLMYPATISGGKLAATVVGTHTTISSLGDQLRTDGFGFDVEYIHSDREVSQVLTERQEEVFFTAVEHGYYESPRACTLTEVADVLDVAKSTCSATLQRAEEAIVEYFCRQQRRSDRIATRKRGVPAKEN
jgi:predicted DNA binding protein